MRDHIVPRAGLVLALLVASGCARRHPEYPLTTQSRPLASLDREVPGAAPDVA